MQTSSLSPNPGSRSFPIYLSDIWGAGRSPDGRSERISQYQVYTNILYGNVEIVQNVPIGHLIVVLSGDEAQRQQALTYLAKQGVRTNVLKTYQQTKQKQNLQVI